MRVRNAIKYVTKGHGRAIRIDSARGKSLENEVDSSKPFFDLTLVSEELAANIKLWKQTESLLRKNRIDGWIRLRGFMTVYQIPDFHIYFNHCFVGDWDYALRGSSYLPFKDFKLKPDANGRLSDWGRTLNLIYDLSERRCSLEFPAALEFNSAANMHGKPTIYSPIPAYEDLVEELKDRRWI